ncbi:g1053 [Coccomyxa elongata]
MVTTRSGRRAAAATAPKRTVPKQQRPEKFPMDVKYLRTMLEAARTSINDNERRMADFEAQVLEDRAHSAQQAQDLAMAREEAESLRNNCNMLQEQLARCVGGDDQDWQVAARALHGVVEAQMGDLEVSKRLIEALRAQIETLEADVTRVCERRSPVMTPEREKAIVDATKRSLGHGFEALLENMSHLRV